MEKKRGYREMQSGFKGSKTLGPGTHTLEFMSIQPSIDGTVISALEGKTDEDAVAASVLLMHIDASVAAGQMLADLTTCQVFVFTEITVDAGGQVTVYL